MDARELLERLAAAASRGDLGEIDALGENARLSESFGRLIAAFPDARVSVEWIVVEGSRGVGWAHITGTHQGIWRGFEPTGRAIDVHGMIAIEISNDGVVKDFWLVNDWLSIATQIGVSLQAPVS